MHLMIIKMVTRRLMINIKKDKLACKNSNTKPCVGETKFIKKNPLFYLIIYQNVGNFKILNNL